MPTFPVLSDTDRPVYPADGLCPVCGAKFTRGFAYLNGGALLMSADGRDSTDSARCRGFLEIGFHGRDPDMRDSAGVTIVSELRGGQFDLSWCSVGCLRVWLLGLLDQVESARGPS